MILKVPVYIQIDVAPTDKQLPQTMANVVLTVFKRRMQDDLPQILSRRRYADDAFLTDPGHFITTLNDSRSVYPHLLVSFEEEVNNTLSFFRHQTRDATG